MKRNLSARAAAVLAAVLSVTACSGLKTYSSTSDDNLLVQTITSSGSPPSSVKTYLHIYRMAGSCPGEHLGSVKLGKRSIQLGVPYGQALYLRFAFMSSSGSGSSTSVPPYDLVMTPSAGAKYIADISYENNIYSVVLRDARGRELESRPPQCDAGG